MDEGESIPEPSRCLHIISDACQMLIKNQDLDQVQKCQKYYNVTNKSTIDVLLFVVPLFRMNINIDYVNLFL